MRKLMRGPVIFDGRNIYNPEQLRAARLHLHLDGPSVSAVLVTGGRGYIGSHGQGPAPSGRLRRHRHDNFPPGIKAAATGARRRDRR